MLDGYTDESTQRDINKTLGGKVILSYKKQSKIYIEFLHHHLFYQQPFSYFVT